MPTPAPKAAKPTKSKFDPFNSSATGHQRADNSLSGSTSWRDSRKLKLNEQFTSGAGGGKRVSDTVGAGSLDFGQDGRLENGSWAPGAKGLRTGGQSSIWESMGVTKDGKTQSDEMSCEPPAKRMKVDPRQPAPSTVVSPFTPFRHANGRVRETSWTSHESSPSHLLSPLDAAEYDPGTAPSPVEGSKDQAGAEDEERKTTSSQIFANLCFYINGSTMPHISDHKLKHLLSIHGGSLSINLGRRTVTHVIIGKPSTGVSGCGGGLAGSKIHKEVTRMRGSAVNYVTVEWVIESVKAGKRLPESRFQAMKLAPKGTGSLTSIFAKQGSSASKKPG